MPSTALSIKYPDFSVLVAEVSDEVPQPLSSKPTVASKNNMFLLLYRERRFFYANQLHFEFLFVFSCFYILFIKNFVNF